MSLNDNQDYIIEGIEIVQPEQVRPQVPEQRYTGTIPKNTSPPSSSVKLEHLPPNFKSIVDRINTGDRVCVIMRGLPGSGKSSLAQQIIEETVKNPKDHIISADNFFMRGGIYRYDPSKITQAHDEAQKLFTRKASFGYSPLIVDNTNVEYWHMLHYLQVAIQYHYHIEILEPSTPWKFKDSMLAARNVHGVPLASIKNLKSRFETGVSLDQLLDSYGLKAVKVPKKRDVPKLVEKPSLAFKPVAPLSIATKPETKTESLGFQPIKESSEVDGGVKKANEWQLRSANNWDLISFSDQKVPSPDSTTADNTADEALTPKGKNRKNKKKNKTKLVAHRMHCPNENQSFSQVRELYPNVNDTYLWDLFERCQGDPNWTVTILIDENKTEHMSSGNQLTCTCFTAEEHKPVETRRVEVIKKSQSPPSSAKKTKQELKQIELMDTKAAIEQSIRFAPEHYPDHVNTVKEWKMPQVPKEELPVVESTAMSSSPDFFDIGDELQPLTISKELLLELDEEYGGGLIKSYMSGEDFEFPSQFFVKKSIAHQLYIELMQCFCSQQEEKKFSDLHKDEELAKELHEQEQRAAANQKTAPKKNAKERQSEFLNELYKDRVDEWDQNDSSEESLARKISKDKLLELFPDFERNLLLEIWKATGYDFQETVDSVKDSLFCSTEERDKVDKAQKEIFNKPWDQKPIQSEDIDGYTSEQLKTVDDLREEIVDHNEERKACQLKAQEAIRSKNFEVATYYSNIAQFHKRRGEECAHEVANLMTGIHEKTQGSSKTLDLHFLNAIEARVALDRFLDKHISKLRTIQKPYTDVSIITGRGANSLNGVPIIKKNSKKRLEERKLHVKDINPGYLGVRVFQNSLLSHDI